MTPSALVTPLARRGLIPFLMAGYPDHATSLRLALALLDEGAVALEIGVPFSDPLADGPAIQLAASRALAAGGSLRRSMQLATEIKAKRPDAILILFTYLNPILREGERMYAQKARAAGLDATLAVDLPPEEADAHVAAHREAGLGTVFLASPTSSPSRLRRIARDSTGFVYAISRVGVTGEASSLSSSLALEIGQLRQICAPLPIAVGFGISNAAQAAEVAQIADAVVIGSRFVSLITDSANAAEAERKTRELARDCVTQIARAHETRPKA